jgi:hypothetical protein
MCRSCRSIFVLGLVGIALMLGNPALGQEITGRLDKRDAAAFVVADKIYQVNAATQLVDQGNNPVDVNDIYPGRNVLVESSIDVGSPQPVATKIIVLEPH